MLHDFHAAFAIAVDMRSAGKLAMAGSAAMHAQAGIVGDSAIAHRNAAAVQHYQSPASGVAGNTVIATDISLCGAGHFHSRSSIAADHVFRPRSAVPSIQEEVCSQRSDTKAAIIANVNTAIHVESAAADADTGADAV